MEDVTRIPKCTRALVAMRLHVCWGEMSPFLRCGSARVVGCRWGRRGLFGLSVGKVFSWGFGCENGVGVEGCVADMYLRIVRIV